MLRKKSQPLSLIVSLSFFLITAIVGFLAIFPKISQTLAAPSQVTLTLNTNPANNAQLKVDIINRGGAAGATDRAVIPGNELGDVSINTEARAGSGFTFSGWTTTLGDCRKDPNINYVVFGSTSTCTLTAQFTGGTGGGTTAASLSVSPAAGLNASGPKGGPFTNSSVAYTLSNTGTAALQWSASVSQTWFGLTATSGSLGTGQSQTVSATVKSAVANTLAVGTYTGTVTFTNTTNGTGNTTRSQQLTVNSAGTTGGGTGGGGIVVQAQNTHLYVKTEPASDKIKSYIKNLPNQPSDAIVNRNNSFYIMTQTTTRLALFIYNFVRWEDSLGCEISNKDLQNTVVKIAINAPASCEVKAIWQANRMISLDIRVLANSLSIEGAKATLTNQQNQNQQIRITDRYGHSDPSFRNFNLFATNYLLKVEKEGYQTYQTTLDSNSEFRDMFGTSQVLLLTYVAQLTPLTGYSPPGELAIWTQPDIDGAIGPINLTIKKTDSGEQIFRGIVSREPAEFELAAGRYTLLPELIGQAREIFKLSEESDDLNAVEIKSMEKTDISLKFDLIDPGPAYGSFRTVLDGRVPIPNVEIMEKSIDDTIKSLGRTDSNGILLAQLTVSRDVNDKKTYYVNRDSLLMSPPLSPPSVFIVEPEDYESVVRSGLEYQKRFKIQIRRPCKNFNNIEVCSTGEEAYRLINDPAYTNALTEISTKIVSLRQTFGNVQPQGLMIADVGREEAADYDGYGDRYWITLSTQLIKNRNGFAAGISSLRNIATHVFGHILDDFKPDDKLNEEKITTLGGDSNPWFRIWRSMKMEYFEKVVRDCNYTFSPPKNECDKEIVNPNPPNLKFFDSDGSPWRYSAEFFASFFKVYHNHRQEFQNNINNLVQPEDRADFTTLMQEIDKLK